MNFVNVGQGREIWGQLPFPYSLSPLHLVPLFGPHPSSKLAFMRISTTILLSFLTASCIVMMLLSCKKKNVSTDRQTERHKAGGKHFFRGISRYILPGWSQVQVEKFVSLQILIVRNGAL